MANPYYTYTQTSFPGRIARASEVNTQFKAIEAGFDALGTIPGGLDTQVQFNDGGNLGGEAAFTYNKATDLLTVPNLTVTTALTGAAGTFSGNLQSAGFTATGAADLQGNVTVGGTLGVTGKATAAATVGGDSATTVVTKGYAESTFAASSHNHAASDITSGTFDNARVAASNVTQHVGSINHDSLLNYSVAQHRVINDASTAATVLWSAQKINNELQSVIAGENPPAGSDGMIQFNNAGVYGGQEELSWDDTTFTLTLGTVTNAGSLNIVGGKATSAATAGGDGATTLTTKGYVDGNFAASSHTHAASDVTSGTFADARIPGLPTSKIDSGTFGVVRGGTGLNSLVASNYIRASTSSSFELRTPAEVRSDIGAAATSHTHDAGDVTTGTFATTRIPSLDAAKITTGTFGAARIPSLDASKITTGTFGSARIPSLDASKIGTGSFDPVRGGTGRTSLSSGYFLTGNGLSAMSQRSPSQVRTDIGAAPTTHTHSTTDIDFSAWTSGSYVRGSGTSAVTMVTPASVRSDIGANNASNLTSGTVDTARLPVVPANKGGTGTAVPADGRFLVGQGGIWTQDDEAGVKNRLDVMASHVSGGGQITVSTSAPSGGSNGDVWLRV